MPAPLLRTVMRGKNEISFRAFLAAAGRPDCSVSALRGHGDVLSKIHGHLAPKKNETAYPVIFALCHDDHGQLIVVALHLRGFDPSPLYNPRIRYVAPGLGEFGNEGSGSLRGKYSEELMWTNELVGHADLATDEIYDWISEESSVDLTDANGELLTEVELRSRFSERRGEFCTCDENCGTGMLGGDTVFWKLGGSEMCFYAGFEPATLEELVERGLVDETGDGILRKTAAEVLRERAEQDEVYGSSSE